MLRVSIVIPAYNEEKRIGNTLRTYSDYFESIREKGVLDYEIVVVINNTTDNTLKIVKEYAEENKKILYLDLKPGGKGFAVIEGFKDALKRNNDLIGFVDADMATRPEEFHRLIGSINNACGAIASRYVRGAQVYPKQNWQRIFVSRLFNMLVRSLLFLPYRDTQCGAKIFKRSAIERGFSKITMSRWAFDVDLLYNIRQKGFRITEIPTVWSDKADSKINFITAGPWMALGIIRLRVLNSPARRFIKIYDKLLTSIKNRKWKR